MKALFKHLSAITQGEPGSVPNNTSPITKNISTPFLSTTLLAVLLGVPQVPIIGSGKAMAQNAASCPAGTAPQTVQFQPGDSLQDLVQEYNIGGINTVLSLIEEVPGQVIDRTESRFTEFGEQGEYGGLDGPNLRLNIGRGKPPETGNLAQGSATLTITFAQPVTLASPLTLLDVDQQGQQDNNRFFRDQVLVSATNNNSEVGVNLGASGNFVRVSGNTATGQIGNSVIDESLANVFVQPQAPVDRITITYRAEPTTVQQRGQDQTIGLAPFTICAGNPATGSIGDTVYRDSNNNNVQDNGEQGIPGATVTLTSPGREPQNLTTDDNGNYTFTDLPAGNYTVTATSPTEGDTPTQTQPDNIELQSGQNRDDVDFGFVGQLGSIGDTVYRDSNNNNVQDNGEQGIPGATVTLTSPGREPQNLTTDDNGNYTFTDLPAGNYTVTATSPTEGDTPTQTQPDNIELQAGQNRDDVDFGFVGQFGSIGDTVYRDSNNNNVQDNGEQGIPGATVTLTSPGREPQNLTTDDNGNYTFTDLPAGNYTVTATSPTEGDTPTQTQPDNIELQSGQNRDDVDFGFVGQLGSIGDTVYADANRNGQQDEGENGIEGATVTLTLPGDESFTPRTITTNEQGIYTFPDLPPGNYTVTATSPRQEDTPTQTQPDPIDLQAGQNIDTVDFGFAPQPLGQGQGSIGDTVYIDENRNNVQDNGEQGIPGATVTLTSPGREPQNATTDDNGNYTFTDLPAGNYAVAAISPREGDTPTQTQPDNIELQAGQNRDDIDFGFVPGQQEGTGSIGDTVYNDLNNNGQQDEGEPGIGGVIVNYAGTGPDGVFGEDLEDDDISGRTRTDANGRYTFPNLPAGTYRVTINDQSQEPIRGFSQTQTPNNPITLDEGENFEDADFGYTQPTGTIGDTVYRDNNSDGTQNEGEPGIGGVVVTLTSPGREPQNVTTDDNGNYSFPNIPTGDYTVTVNNPPDGLNPTQTPSNPVSLQPGETFNDADFGFSPQQVGTIGDFVFFDNDGDSTPDSDESGISGITLVLRDAQNNEVATTTTDEDGFYTFVAPPGTYTVTVGNPPQGLTATLTQDNPVTLQAGQNIDTVDFGFQPPRDGSIGDTVFADGNGNGTQDPGEPGVSGVLIRLFRGDQLIDEQRTDNTETVAFNDNTPGQYTFDNLPPGDYEVQMVLPDGSILTTGSNPIPVDLQPSQNLDSADFGIRMTGFGGDNPGSIGDEVFNDIDGDGVRDEGEPGVPGVPVTLTLPGDDEQLGTDDDIVREPVLTNDQGIYTFDDLPPGDYRVSVTPPLNLPEVTNPSGPQIETSLEPGQNLTNVDFGLRSPEGGSIGDTVFVDSNGNGVQDFTDSNNNGVKDPNEEGEEGIPGVQLTLRDSNGNTVDTTTTNNNGNYVFNGLPLANFTVEAARPTDFSPTTETTLPAQLTEANPTTNEVDFGFRPGRLGASGPTNLRLVKRITNVLRGNTPISGIAFNQFEDDPNDDDDNIFNSSPQSSPVGITRLESPVQSGDIVEYTIYFLSEGGEALQNVRVCDLIPDGTTFVNGSIGVNGGGNGADNGEFLTPLSPVPANFQNICLNGTPANGAVLTNLGTLPAGGQFGFVRFRVRVN